VRAGFSSVVFTGTSGTNVADFVAGITGLDAVYRFDGPTQAWQSYAPGRPPFLNQITTLTGGDTLFIQATGTSLLEQVDLLPRDGTSRVVILSKGANFVSYTGASGDAATVLAGITGLEKALRFDSATQQWVSYSPTAPSLLNSLKTLSRLDGVLLVVDATTSWTFAEAP
jgi:hypothetical protein